MKKFVYAAAIGAMLVSGNVFACEEWEKVNGKCPEGDVQVSLDQAFSNLGSGQRAGIQWSPTGENSGLDASLGHLDGKLIGHFSARFGDGKLRARYDMLKDDGVITDASTLSLGRAFKDEHGRMELRGMAGVKTLSPIYESIGLGVGVDLEGVRALRKNLTLNYRLNGGLLAGIYHEEETKTVTDKINVTDVDGNPYVLELDRDVVTKPRYYQDGIGTFLHAKVGADYAVGERVYLTAEALYSEGRTKIVEEGVTTTLNPSNAQFRVGARVRLGR